jgi:hypothetical protein
MAYFMINGVDYSQYVNKLSIDKAANYSSQTNASGDTVVDFINAKRTIEVGIIPLDGESMAQLLAAIDAFNVSISFRNPLTNALEEGVNCIIPSSGVEYYTIQANKVLFNAFSLTFTEL